ncbi:MAG: hypothetical protein HYV63_14705 [Candidatus Schekmanbacteria bacterium]|nr:hypothetical protein [Candidatus Schekmanbacteria bacterium]
MSHATELVDTGRFDEAMPILRDLINVSSLYSADRAILGTKARLEAVRAHLGKGELTEAHSAADGILTRHWPGGEGLWASTAREMFGARIASEPVEESDDFLVFRAKVYYWSARLLDEANQGGVRLPRQPSARGAPGGAARQEVLRRSPCHFREGAAAIGCMVEQAVSDTGRVAGRMPAGCRNGASESRCAIYHDALAYRAALAAIAPLLSNTHGGAAPPPELVAARTALTAPTRHQRLRFAEAAYYGALQARDGAAVKEVCALPDARDAGLCTGAMAARLKSEAAAAANATAQPPRKPLMALPAPFQLELDRLLEDTATCSWTAEQAGASRLLRLGPDAYVSIAPDGEIDSVRIPVAIGQELANARTGGQVSFGHEAPFFIWFAANAASADSADDKARALCALNRAARDGNLPLLRHLISRYFDSASQRH